MVLGVEGWTAAAEPAVLLAAEPTGSSGSRPLGQSVGGKVGQPVCSGILPVQGKQEASLHGGIF